MQQTELPICVETIILALEVRAGKEMTLKFVVITFEIVSNLLIIGD